MCRAWLPRPSLSPERRRGSSEQRQARQTTPRPHAVGTPRSRWAVPPVVPCHPPIQVRKPIDLPLARRRREPAAGVNPSKGPSRTRSPRVRRGLQRGMSTVRSIRSRSRSGQGVKMSQEPRDKAELSGTVRCAMSNGGSSPISPLDADRKLPAADIAGDRHTGWPERAWANMAPVLDGLADDLENLARHRRGAHRRIARRRSPGAGDRVRGHIERGNRRRGNSPRRRNPATTGTPRRSQISGMRPEVSGRGSMTPFMPMRSRRIAHRPSHPANAPAAATRPPDDPMSQFHRRRVRYRRTAPGPPGGQTSVRRLARKPPDVAGVPNRDVPLIPLSGKPRGAPQPATVRSGPHPP